MTTRDADIGTCTVCGFVGPHLSSLDRCLPCIHAAGQQVLRPETPTDYRPRWRQQKWPDPATDPDPETRSLWVQVLWPEPAPRPPRPPAQPLRPGAAQARFRGLLHHLSTQPEGARNETLFWVACRVGDMIDAGEIAHPAVAVDLLTDVALDTCLSASEVRGTIASGLSSAGVHP